MGPHAFDVTIRLLEEAIFHPTPGYFFLDKTLGISKVDPIEQLGIYKMIQQALQAQTVPLPAQMQMSVPTALPPPPALASGGQVAIVQVPYRPKRPTPTFG